MKQATKAEIVLLLVTFVWGAGFPIAKFALQSIGPMYHIGLRFLIATILLCIIFHRKLKELSWSIVKPAFLLSIFLFLCFALQTVGLLYTTASKSGFFSGLSVIIVPFISLFYLKTKIKRKTFLGIIISSIGLFLLSYTGSKFTFNIGDFITILGTVSYGWQLLLTGTYVQKHDATLLAIVQLFFVSIWGFAGAIFFDTFPQNVTPLSFWSLMFSAILCTAFAFWAQTTMQKFTSASHIAIIWTLEPVFGAILSFLLLHEMIGLKGIIGGFLVVFAMIISEIDFVK